MDQNSDKPSQPDGDQPDPNQPDQDAAAEKGSQALTQPDASGDSASTDIIEPPGEIEILLPASQTAAEAEQALSRFTDVRPYVLAGVAALILLVGSFTVWSVAAPLARGVIAPGELKVESSRKTIQHLEGGIIEEIRVREGANVEAGDVLMVLQNARADANQNIIESRLFAAQAREARLLAQRDGLADIRFPEALLAAAEGPEADPILTEILDGQRATFAQQRETLMTRRGILDEQINQLNDQIAGLEAQIRAYNEQQRLIAEEIEDVSFLLEKGLVERPRLRALQRTAASLDGEIESSRSAIAQGQQRIAEIRLQRIELDNAQQEQVLNQLREVQDQIADLRDESAAAADVVDRLVVRAPEAGQIVDLQFSTVGGVVAPGQAIADLVPQTDNLVITTQIAPLNIDSVTVGLPAEIILSAFNQNMVPRLKATVTRVSADRLTDERTGMGYFEASVAIDPGELDRLPEDYRLYPGMPADVVIVTGERSAFSYLVSPLTDIGRRGLVAE